MYIFMHLIGRKRITWKSRNSTVSPWPWHALTPQQLRAVDLTKQWTILTYRTDYQRLSQLSTRVFGL